MYFLYILALFGKPAFYFQKITPPYYEDIRTFTLQPPYCKYVMVKKSLGALPTISNQTVLNWQQL